MKVNTLALALFILFTGSVSALFAQQDTGKEFIIGLEFRPRSEFRYGYRVLRSDSVTPAFFTSQRTRLNFTYKQKHFVFHTSIQDTRVWGDANFGTMQAFEGYVEPYFNDRFSVRIGRQKLAYDNSRLFAENDWRQSARSHDGINFRYDNPKKQFNTELAMAFNQPFENVYGTNYSYYIYLNYKMLFVNYLRKKIGEHITITTINSGDGYQDRFYAEKTNMRYTNGGRISWEDKIWYFTFSGYYQHGRNFIDQKIKAYYFQPEVSYRMKKWTAKLGMEWMSGSKANNPNAKNETGAFVPLYGVAHKFNGFMDYFITFPSDLGNAGLINPYFYVYYQLNRKLAIKNHFHMFYLEQDFLYMNVPIDKYLGFEHDVLLNYNANEFTSLEFGISYMLAKKSMEYLKGGGNSALTPVWAYLMVSFKPELLRIKR